MRKIFCILFLLFFCYTGAFAAEDLKIITREEWWADENYRFRDSYEWKLIFKQKEIDALKRQNIVYDESQLLEFKERQAKLSKMDKILLEEYWKYVEIESTEYDESGRKYAWPIQKSKEINWIVIHHTVSEYTNSMEWIKQIYKFHALSREWWDIWYNYLIWNDGEIYEWRAGWDKVVAAHDKWNNRSTIGIAVIWNYHSKEININQYNALKALTKQLIEKHDINLNEKTYFHKECLGKLENIPIILPTKQEHWTNFYDRSDDLEWAVLGLDSLQILSFPEWRMVMANSPLRFQLPPVELYVLQG